MRVVVAGSTGLIGGALVEALSASGDEVACLVRRPAGGGEIRWEPERRSIDVSALEGMDGFVNLAGAGIGDHRWTEARKKEIFDSRVVATTFLSETIASLRSRPRVFVNASAVGIYGNRGSETLTEQSTPGRGFLADLCRSWESSTLSAEQAGVRVVHLRSGVVLAKDGGALRRQLPLFRLGLGGRLGRGDQWLSWITLRDEISVLRKLLDDETLAGAINSCAPKPVTNRAFTRELGRILHRPTLFTVPAFALGLALGRELAEELPLTSQRALPARLEESGFKFEDPDIESALMSVLSR